jgi:glycosyltransferase involved in cell wall biosynthesis
LLVPIVDLELTNPLGALGPIDCGRQRRVVARLHGVPVADAVMPAGVACDERELRRALLAVASEAVVRELLRRALLAGATGTPEAVTGAPPRTGSGGGATDLTIAVCTRDRAASLTVLLETITGFGQPSPVLVVDNAPADETTAQVAARFPRVRYLRELQPGLDHARNAALAATQTEGICFIDDDAQPERQWAPGIAAALAESPELDAVTGFVLPGALETQAQVDFENWGGFARTPMRRWFLSSGHASVVAAVRNPAAIGVGVNMAFRVASLRRAGGFDPLLDAGARGRAGGDVEALLRLLAHGGTILYDPAIVVRHDHRRTAAELHAQVEAWSHGYVAALLRFAATFPGERVPVARVIGLGLIPWNVRRLLLPRARDRFPRAFAWSEVRGQLRALSQIHAWSTRRASLEPPASALAPARQHRLSLVVDLQGPLRPIPEAEDVRELHVELNRGGALVAHTRIATAGRHMSAARLADALVAGIPSAAFGSGFPAAARRLILGD